MVRESEIYDSRTPNKEHVQFWRAAAKKFNSSIPISRIDDVANLPPRLISDIVQEATCARVQEFNICSWEEQVAPNKEIRSDHKRLMKTDKMLLLSPKTAHNLTSRAIVGHAQNGHGRFTMPCPNTNTKNVMDAMSRDLKTFQIESQQLSDNIVHYIESWFNHAVQSASTTTKKSRIIKLQNEYGEPLNGLDFLRDTPIDILEFARGFYFGSLMDNYEIIRRAGFQKYGHQMGGGGSYVANTNLLKKFGIGASDLSKIGHQGLLKVLNYMTSENKVGVLKHLGIIQENSFSLEEILREDFSWDGIKSHETATNLTENPECSGYYIRDVRGKGVGDDIAIFLSAFLPQTYTMARYLESHQAHHSRMIGTLMADQIDTIEKDSSIFLPGGQDEVAGQYINRLFRKACRDKEFRRRFNIKYRKDGQYNLVDRDTIVDFTVASANTRN
ncbi:MAG: hypothetical protein OEL89_04525, partial [Candidatus Peregrinibacteria bacterium]|nr:hypothetical protein [Candidatus Peregrinibacteria bacterium]